MTTINEGGQDAAAREGSEPQQGRSPHPVPPSPDDYPTIARLADLSRSTVGYQNHELCAEAVRCWHALSCERERAERAEAERDALLAANKDCMAHYDDARHDIERLTTTNAELATECAFWRGAP